MRVLILHSRYRSSAPSGENRVVDDEVRLLEEAGHAVSVWTPSPEGLHGLDLVRTGAGAVWSRKSVAEVRRLVRRRRPDVIHCHNVFPLLSPAVLRAASDDGAAVVMTLHNYRLLCLPATFVRDGRVCEDCLGRSPWPGVLHRCYRGSAAASAAIATSLVVHRRLGTFNRTTLYLAVSDFVRRKHIEAGWPGDRIRVKSNFAWSAPRREGPGRYFLYLGRLSAEKGLPDLLEAWRGVGYPLWIVGDGPDAGELKAAAPAGVEFRGSVPPSEVPELLRHARALVLPSLCYEGQPRSMLEAYSAGVPAVATRHGSLSELVADGTSGLLVPPRNPDALRDAVARLLDDAVSERLGAGALRMWHENYSPERSLEGLESAYRDAIGSR